MLFSPGAWIENFPWPSDVVPMLVPFTTTLTAASGMPLSSFMVPVTVIEFCPNRWAEGKKKIRSKAK
jgi:hypothetical protein